MADVFGADAVFGFNRSDDLGGIRDGSVDLAAGRVGFDSGVDQRRQGLAGLAEAFGNQQPGDHAAVAVGEVAEVVVGAHFAAVDRVFVTHSLFDEGVAGFAFDGFAPSRLNEVEGVPGQAGVVDDFAAAGFAQELVGEQTNNVIALDKTTVFVEEEAAVVVAVPGNAHGGTFCDNGVSGGGAIFRQNRIGDAVGEMAVGFMVYFYEFEGQVLFELVDDKAGAAVTGVDGNGHWRE